MRAVILDIDGTLLESAADDDLLFRRAVGDVLGGVELRPELSDYPSVTDTAILRQITEDNGLEFASLLLADVQAAFTERVAAFIAANGPFRPVPGASGFLSKLKHSPEVSVAVATGGWRATAALKLDSAGLKIDAPNLATSDDAETRTGIMRIALNSLGGTFDSITYLGDGPWDQRATRELGWQIQPVGAALNGILAFDELAELAEWRWLDE